MPSQNLTELKGQKKKFQPVLRWEKCWDYKSAAPLNQHRASYSKFTYIMTASCKNGPAQSFLDCISPIFLSILFDFYDCGTLLEDPTNDFDDIRSTELTLWISVLPPCSIYQLTHHSIENRTEVCPRPELGPSKQNRFGNSFMATGLYASIPPNLSQCRCVPIQT